MISRQSVECEGTFRQFLPFWTQKTLKVNHMRWSTTLQSNSYLKFWKAKTINQCTNQLINQLLVSKTWSHFSLYHKERPKILSSSFSRKNINLTFSAFMRDRDWPLMHSIKVLGSSLMLQPVLTTYKTQMQVHFNHTCISESFSESWPKRHDMDLEKYMDLEK